MHFSCPTTRKMHCFRPNGKNLQRHGKGQGARPPRDLEKFEDPPSSSYPSLQLQTAS